MVRTVLPAHATLLDPATGAPLRALGIRKDGRPVWPAMGAEDTPPPGPPADPNTPPADPDPDGDDEKLSAGGVKALKAERAKAAAAEKRAAAAEQKLADDAKAKLGEKERAEVERDEARKEAAEAKAEVARIRVGHKYGLSPEDVADLSTAGTPEDFDARAKRLSERLKGTGATPGSAGGLPPSPNAGRGNGKAPSGSEQGMAELYKRFPELAAKK
jgi:hypothetical protein